KDLIMARNSRGNGIRYTYDAQLRRTGVIDPLAHVSRLGYDAKHHPIATTDAVGNQTAAAYYPNGLVNTTTDGRGTTSTLTYDAKGNPLTSRVGTHPLVN